MAQIGCLGNIVFEVSEKTVRTVDKFKWSGSARHAVHQRHGGNALSVFEGLDPDQLAFQICFTPQLGTEPMKEIWDLWRLMRKGTTLPLTIGEHAYGRYRWTITSMNIDAQYFDINGDIYYAAVSLKLQEYRATAFEILKK